MKNQRNEEQFSEMSSQKSRREFLEMAGKLAVYTPPVVMGLLYPGAHAIASGCRGRRCGGGNTAPGGPS